MTDPNWDDFRPEDGRPPAPTAGRTAKPSVAVPAAIAALLAGAAVAAYLAFLRPSSAPVGPAAPPAATHPPTASAPLGGRADAIDVPRLDETDGLVRRLVGRLSASGLVNAWLSGTGLIRNFAAVTVNLEEGATPAKLLPRLRPAGSFRVIDRGGRTVVDPRSYERYDSAADAIVGLDPAQVARVYATLKPRIEEAYRDLGFTDRSFDRALQGVIVTLVRTPVPDDEPVVRRKGLRYVYEDEAFETLTGAQKQFLRMGARNVRRVDAWLRRLADALGIPAAAFSAT